MLFGRLRKTAAKDVWAAETPEYAELERKAMITMGWIPGMVRQVAFPIQMKARAQLFGKLPAEQRLYWAEKAKQAKEAPPTKYYERFAALSYI